MSVPPSGANPAPPSRGTPSPTAHIQLAVLLPDVPEETDACVERLSHWLIRHRGITDAHLEQRDRRPVLCVHYDPALIVLAQVERLARAAGARLSADFGHVLIPLRLTGAEDEGMAIERAVRGGRGVVDVSVNVAAQLVRVEFKRSVVSEAEIVARLRELAPAGDAPAAPAPEMPPVAAAALPAWRRHRELLLSLVAGALVLGAWLMERNGASRTLIIAIYGVGYAAGAADLIQHTLKAWRRGAFSFDIDLLMLLAAAGAAALGEWVEGGLLLTLFALAHALEHYALDRARGAIRALARLAPPVARVERNGQQVEVHVEHVQVGDVVTVRPAERIPVDGVVVAGRSGVNQAPITGESVPVDKDSGDEVFAGTVNGEGALQIRTTRAVGDRTLDRVVKLVEEAQTQKAPTQQFSEKFERIFVPVILAADAGLILVPPLFFGAEWQPSIYRGMSLLVAASPCALAIGTPAAVLAAIARAARAGVLIKGGVHLENLGRLRVIAFDKTGTLTEGRPEVTDVIAAEGSTADELLRLSAAVEHQSQHPLAQAVVRRAKAGNLLLPDAGPLESITGRGVRATVEGAVVEIGSARFWEERGIEIPLQLREAATALEAAGRSLMHIQHGSRWLGVLGLADQPRVAARPILAELRALGLGPLVMLTGDNRGVAEAVGRELGIDEVRGQLLPEDKVTAITELREKHGALAMVGDGINDAPALAQATVGIAMGGAGTAVALETADVALMADDLTKLPFAIDLSRRAVTIIRQNLWISMAVIALLVVTSVSGASGMALAVAVHEGSTLLVIANALRLLR